jgi:heme/copper-type cytochrome/quinol oxidase subunit 3
MVRFTSLNKRSVTPIHYYNNVPYTLAPCYISLSLFVIAFASVCGFSKMSFGAITYFRPLVVLSIYVGAWTTELTPENYFGRYNKKILNSLFLAFILFLLPEVFLSVGFSRVLIDRYSANPAGVAFAGHLISINCTGAPSLGTGMLPPSGYYLNLAYLHRAHTEIYDLYNQIALLLGIVFLSLQLFEYQELFVRISNTVYTSIFYIITGFHGLHVCVGLLMMFLNDTRVSWNAEVSTPRRRYRVA